MTPAPADVYRAEFAAISIATGTTQALVAAQTGAEIIVLSYVINAVGATVLNFLSDDDSIIGTGLSLAAKATVTAPYNRYGHFKTVAGEPLNLASTEEVVVSGHITYVVAKSTL